MNPFLSKRLAYSSGPDPEVGRLVVVDLLEREARDEHRAGAPVQVEADGADAVRDERDEHDEHLDRARPVREVRPVVLERVELPLQVLVVVRQRAPQRAPRDPSDHAHAELAPVRVVHEPVDEGSGRGRLVARHGPSPARRPVPTRSRMIKSEKNGAT